LDPFNISDMAGNIKREEVSAGTDALDIIPDEDSSSLDTNALLFDLTELLKRDPTLSSLNPVKDEPLEDSNHQGQTGVPIPGGGHSFHHPQQSSQAVAASSLGAFGTGSSSMASSNVTASPLLASPPVAGMLYTTSAQVRVTVGMWTVHLRILRQRE